MLQSVHTLVVSFCGRDVPHPFPYGYGYCEAAVLVCSPGWSERLAWLTGCSAFAGPGFVFWVSPAFLFRPWLLGSAIHPHCSWTHPRATFQCSPHGPPCFSLPVPTWLSAFLPPTRPLPASFTPPPPYYTHCFGVPQDSSCFPKPALFSVSGFPRGFPGTRESWWSSSCLSVMKVGHLPLVWQPCVFLSHPLPPVALVPDMTGFFSHTRQLHSQRG